MISIRPSILPILCGLLGAALLPGRVAHAQDGASVGTADARSEATTFESGGAIEEADSLYFAGEVEAALEVLREHLRVDSLDADALWRAARASVEVGRGIEGNREQNAWFDPAIAWARRATEVHPGGLDGHYWLGAASGERAHNAGTSYAVELAQVTWEQANVILATDSLHGGGHNMLGKLNYEVMSLSRIKRFLARTFLGNDALDDMRWENAEFHLAEAARVWPGVVLFHYDLALLHRKRGRREEAIVEFRTVLSLPAIHPGDAAMKEEARAQLDDWAGVKLADADGVTSPPMG